MYFPPKIVFVIFVTVKNIDNVNMFFSLQKFLFGKREKKVLVKY